MKRIKHQFLAMFGWLRSNVPKAVLIGTSLVVVSCFDGSIENDWLRYRPADTANSRWDELPAERVREVRPDMQEEAVRLLANQSARRVDGEQAARLVGSDIVRHGGRPLYLLRAVRVVTAGDSVRVLTSGHNVAVEYSVLSSRTTTYKTGLVAELLDDPRVVYVELQVAR